MAFSVNIFQLAICKFFKPIRSPKDFSADWTSAIPSTLPQVFHPLAKLHCWPAILPRPTAGSRVPHCPSRSPGPFQQSCSPEYVIEGVIPTQMQDFANVLAKFSRVPIDTFFQHASVSLDCSLTPECNPTHLLSCVNLMRTFCYLFQAIDEGVK